VSKKGPRSDAFHLMTASLSEEVVAHYLDLAHYVRAKELARRREIERAKAAERRRKQAELAARLAEALKAAGLAPPPKVTRAKKKASKKASQKKETMRSARATSKAGNKAEIPPAAETLTTPCAAAQGDDDSLAPEGTPKPSRRAKPITREDILKLVIADELGYLPRVRADGWGGLTTAQSGRVGGMMTRRMKGLARGGQPSRPA
jgi:hypothetical protein